jgi:hypothetical protein
MSPIAAPKGRGTVAKVLGFLIGAAIVAAGIAGGMLLLGGT